MLHNLPAIKRRLLLSRNLWLTRIVTGVAEVRVGLGLEGVALIIAIEVGIVTGVVEVRVGLEVEGVVMVVAMVVGIVTGVVEVRVGLGVEGVVMVVAMEVGIVTGVVEVRVGLGQAGVDLMIVVEMGMVEDLKAIEKVSIKCITHLPTCDINTDYHILLNAHYHTLHITLPFNTPYQRIFSSLSFIFTLLHTFN